MLVVHVRKGADAARCLGYLPFHRIHDGRNEAPEIYTPRLVDAEVEFNSTLAVCVGGDPYLLKPSFGYTQLEYRKPSPSKRTTSR